MACLLTLQSTKKLIPILSWDQVAALVNVEKISPDEIQAFLPHCYTDKVRWYAMHVKGDTMTASLSYSKCFHEGEIIIVDPDKTVSRGCYVIALLPRSKEVTFKQYVVDGGVHYLKPLNPQYPIVQIDDSTHICGIVVMGLSQF